MSSVPQFMETYFQLEPFNRLWMLLLQYDFFSFSRQTFTLKSQMTTRITQNTQKIVRVKVRCASLHLIYLNM
jgi:hypothetical protein